MKPFEVYVTYVSWDGINGKNRPVLAFILSECTVDVYQITTKYANKSEAIRANFFKIDDWTACELTSESYIDIGTIMTLPIQVLKNKAPLGQLTENDKLRFLAFLNKD